MANGKIKQARVKIKNGIATAKVVVFHEMSTYNQMKTRTGNPDDANFITRMTATVKGETVFDMSSSQFFSKNPIFEFKFKADTFQAGDALEIVATDRKGNTLTESTKIR